MILVLHSYNCAVIYHYTNLAGELLLVPYCVFQLNWCAVYDDYMQNIEPIQAYDLPDSLKYLMSECRPPASLR